MRRIGILMKIFYSPSYTVAAHSFETTRKSRWIAESLAREPIAGIELVAPEPTSVAVLTRVHDPAYVAAVRTGKPLELAQSQGFKWDKKLWKWDCRATGGLSDAAIRPLGPRRASGSLSSGLHHARRARGAGFCTSSPPVRRSTQAPAPCSSLISTRIVAAARMSSSRATSG